LKTRVTGDFYREDAARIASEAARLRPASAEKSAKPPEAAPAYVPPVLLDEPQRPLLVPEPPLNQNAARREPELVTPRSESLAPPRRREEPRTERYEEERPRPSFLRTVAWIVLLPLYLGVAAAAIGVNVLFVKDLLGF
jgi:hypothetical protein